MSKSTKQKDIAYFLDRALPVAKMDIIRGEKGSPPIFIEAGPTDIEMQEYLRIALKILADYAPNYGTGRKFGIDMTNYFPVIDTEIDDWWDKVVSDYNESEPYNMQTHTIYFNRAEAYDNYKQWCIKNHRYAMAERKFRVMWNRKTKQTTNTYFEEYSLELGKYVWRNVKLRRIFME